MIAAQGLGFRHLVREVTLDVQPGDVIALFGANGAGKSTLLSLLAGDRRPTAGTISYAGRDLSRIPSRELARYRAVLRQHSQLTAAFTALDVVRLGRDDREVAGHYLSEVGLRHLATRVYPSLSGGEQQRVHLARVLAQVHARHPSAIFLDEPNSAADLRATEVVDRLVTDAAVRGHAIILVAHDVATIARCATRVLVMHEGRVIADTPRLSADDAARAFDVSPEWIRQRMMTVSW
ncbi:MAG TPA: ATP-binding cassette domain-containing protein [Kofleriaceae bacterium]